MADCSESIVDGGAAIGTTGGAEGVLAVVVGGGLGGLADGVPGRIGGRHVEEAVDPVGIGGQRHADRRTDGRGAGEGDGHAGNTGLAGVLDAVVVVVDVDGAAHRRAHRRERQHVEGVAVPGRRRHRMHCRACRCGQGGQWNRNGLGIDPGRIGEVGILGEVCGGRVGVFTDGRRPEVAGGRWCQPGI